MTLSVRLEPPIFWSVTLCMYSILSDLLKKSVLLDKSYTCHIVQLLILLKNQSNVFLITKD